MKSLFLLTILLLSPIAQAGASIEAKVLRVGKYGGGKLMVVLDTTIPEAGCEKPRFDIPGNHPNIDAYMSLALAAAMSKTTIKVQTNGCYSGYPTVDETQDSLFYVKLD